MITIFKYELDQSPKQISMPQAAKVLSVGVQKGKINIWALVDTETEPSNRLFIIHGTGHELLKDTNMYNFIGTVLLENGGLVLHVFEDLS